MKKLSFIYIAGLFAALFGPFVVYCQAQHNSLTGAWKYQSDTAEQVLIFQDNYSAHTSYSKGSENFLLYLRRKIFTAE